jgi:hypothetical protein
MRIVLALLFSLTTAVVTFAQDPVKVDPVHYRVLFDRGLSQLHLYQGLQIMNGLW